MNICILDRGSRGGLAGFIHHYSRLGHNVFVPMPGIGDLNWKMSPLWPVLLHRSLINPKKTNYEIHRNEINLIYGEDLFLENEECVSPITDESIKCQLINFEKENIKIDAFHTTDHVASEIERHLRFKEKHFPNAKWISSSFDHFNRELGNSCSNICRMLPGNYDNLYKDKNSVNFYRNQVEFEILGVEAGTIKNNRSGFASFNHNFHVRHPREFQIFSEMNKILADSGINVQNYGGNVRKFGADLRYDLNGPTGNYKTLSPREAARTYNSLKAVIHFKGYDWAGGVDAYCRFSRTPMIVLKDYVTAIHAQNILVNNINCIYVSNAKEAANAVLLIENDDTFRQQLSAGMEEIAKSLHNNEYYSNWNNMILNLC